MIERILSVEFTSTRDRGMTEASVTFYEDGRLHHLHLDTERATIHGDGSITHTLEPSPLQRVTTIE